MRSPLHSRWPWRALALLSVMAVVALALTGCGASSSSSTARAGAGGATTTSGHVNFAKTKFVLHAGLAFGAFHRYIYKPYRAGDFRHPTFHKLAVIKAALAAGFVYHELKLALHDAQSSPTLSKLVAPITALDNRLHGLGGALRGGDTGQLSSDNGSIGQVEGQSAHAGQPIQEQAPAGL